MTTQLLFKYNIWSRDTYINTQSVRKIIEI